MHACRRVCLTTPALLTRKDVKNSTLPLCVISMALGSPSVLALRTAVTSLSAMTLTF